MTQPNPNRLDMLVHWYSLFCTLVDAYQNGDYTRFEFVEKIEQLREELADAVQL